MQPRPLFVWENALATAGVSWSATSQLGRFAPSFLADPVLERRWRAAPSASVTATFPAATAVQAVAATFYTEHALPSGGTLRAELLDGAAATLADSGNLALTADAFTPSQLLLALDAPVSPVSLRLSFELTGPGFVDLAAVTAGLAYQPGRNYQRGAVPLLDNASRETVARSGRRIVDRRAKRRGYRLPLAGLAPADSAELELRRHRHADAAFLFCLDPTAPAACTMLATFEAEISWPFARHHAAELTLWQEV